MPENEFENTPRLPAEEGRLQVRLLEGRTMNRTARSAGSQRTNPE